MIYIINFVIIWLTFANNPSINQQESISKNLTGTWINIPLYENLYGKLQFYFPSSICRESFIGTGLHYNATDSSLKINIHWVEHIYSYTIKVDSIIVNNDEVSVFSNEDEKTKRMSLVLKLKGHDLQVMYQPLIHFFERPESLFVGRKVSQKNLEFEQLANFFFVKKLFPKNYLLENESSIFLGNSGQDTIRVVFDGNIKFVSVNEKHAIYFQLTDFQISTKRTALVSLLFNNIDNAEWHSYLADFNEDGSIIFYKISGKNERLVEFILRPL
jgi:hypothetical protein